MKKSVNKKGGFGIILLVVVVILVLGVGGYFIFFLEKCKDNEIFNPYQDVCVGKRVLCNLDRDCTLLEGQTGFFTEESLSFELISARNDDGRGFTTINIAGLGEVNMIEQDDFDFGEYTIGFESVDGDSDKIMGASFEVTSNTEEKGESKILYETIPVSATHFLISSGSTIDETENVTLEINNSEGDYLDKNYYVHIPGGDPKNHNSHDFIEINFLIPSDFVNTENELFVKIKLACGDYGEIFIKSSNKFGDFDNLERVKCETENWEEKEIIVSSGIVWTENPLIVLKRDGGRGQVKIDSVEIFVKG